MAGPRLDRTSERARRFAGELIGAASENVGVWDHARLGPFGLRVGTSTQDDIGGLIRGAFLPGRGMAPTFSLAIARHGEIDRLPPLFWAKPWIDAARPVPSEISHPYRVFIDRQVGVAYAFDRSAGRGAVWVRRPSELDLRSFITPFRLMLAWMADTQGAEVLHASAAVVNGRAVAFSGASGSGKSTLAIGLGLKGHSLICDDCLLLHEGMAHAVFGRAKLDDAAMAIVDTAGLDLRLPHDTPRAKRYFDVTALGSGFAPESPLHVWGFPVIGLGTGQFRLSQRRAYRMLSADSLREIFGGGPRNQLRIARAVRAHPAFRILVGSSMIENAAVVESIVRDAEEVQMSALAEAGTHG